MPIVFEAETPEQKRFMGHDSLESIPEAYQGFFRDCYGRLKKELIKVISGSATSGMPGSAKSGLVDNDLILKKYFGVCERYDEIHLGLKRIHNHISVNDRPVFLLVTNSSVGPKPKDTIVLPKMEIALLHGKRDRKLDLGAKRYVACEIFHELVRLVLNIKDSKHCNSDGKAMLLAGKSPALAKMNAVNWAGYFKSHVFATLVPSLLSSDDKKKTLDVKMVWERLTLEDPKNPKRLYPKTLATPGMGGSPTQPGREARLTHVQRQKELKRK